MPDLFISDAREDRGTAFAVAQALQSQGIGLWWDREPTGEARAPSRPGMTHRTGRSPR